MNTEDFIKKHLNFSDRDLEYRPIFKYWQTLELMEEYHQAKLKLLGIADVVGQSEQLPCKHPISKRARDNRFNLICSDCGKTL